MQSIYSQRIIEKSRLKVKSKQTQFKANTNPIKPNNESKIRGAKPIQTQFVKNQNECFCVEKEFKMMIVNSTKVYPPLVLTCFTVGGEI